MTWLRWNTMELVPDDAGTFAARLPKDTFELQLALVRHRISPGSLDGVMGEQTKSALRVFQTVHDLPVTGEADPATRSRLMLESPPLAKYVVTAEDLSRLRTLNRDWLGKSQQDCLGYETVLELIAERSLAHPKFISQLNPSNDWNHVMAGASVWIPNAAYPPVREKAAFVRIMLGERMLQVYDSSSNLLAHFPCSIGRVAEKRPVGRLEVADIVEDPNYTFNPQIFHESQEARQLGRKLIVPPGPNNPVGVAWMGLNQPGYGIHGTPEPEKIGRTESRGCFRLANWNAAYLLKLVWVSMPVYVEL